MINDNTLYRILRSWHARLRDPLLTVLLAIQVFSIFIMPPLRTAGLNIPRIVVVSILLGFVALAISSSRSRVARIMLALSVGLTIAGNIWHSANPDMLTNIFIGIGQVLTQISLIWVGERGIRLGAGDASPYSWRDHHLS